MDSRVHGNNVEVKIKFANCSKSRRPIKSTARKCVIEIRKVFHVEHLGALMYSGRRLDDKRSRKKERRRDGVQGARRDAVGLISPTKVTRAWVAYL